MSCFKVFDNSNNKVEILIDGEKNLKSNFIGGLNLLALIFISAVFWFFFSEIIKKEKPRMIINNSFDSNPGKISLENIDFMLGVQNKLDGAKLIYPQKKLLNIDIQVWTFNDETKQINITTLSAIRCSEAVFSSETNKNLFKERYSLENSVCLDRTKTNPKDLYVQGNFGVSGFQMMLFVINKCKENECQENWKDILNFFWFKVMYIDNNIFNENFENPVQPVVKEIFWEYSLEYDKTGVFYINKLFFKDDIGFLFESIKEKNSFLFAKNIEFSQSVIRPGRFGSFNFQSGKEKTEIIRSYIKIQEILSFVGGMMKFLTVIIEILIYYYSQNFFNEEILKFMIRNNLISISIENEELKSNSFIMLKENSAKEIKENAESNENKKEKENKKGKDENIEKEKDRKIKNIINEIIIDQNQLSSENPIRFNKISFFSNFNNDENCNKRENRTLNLKSNYNNSKYINVNNFNHEKEKKKEKDIDKKDSYKDNNKDKDIKDIFNRRKLNFQFSDETKDKYISEIELSWLEKLSCFSNEKKTRYTN